MVCRDKKSKGLEEYGGRWQTGLCLAKGFNLEDKRMTAAEKIDRLMVVLPTGFVLACRAGEAGDKRWPIRVKKHGSKVRSLFRASLDWLVSVLFRGIRLVDLLDGEMLHVLAVKESTG